MATCFIFVKYWKYEGCLSLLLNQQGEILAPLAQRSFSEIQTLQAHAKTIVIVPSEHFSLYRVELPWLPEKKARAALPYALEDQVAEPVEELHFAFDKRHYQNGRYLVVVCKKNYLVDTLAQCHDHQLHVDTITLDWFALANKEACILDTSLLIYDDSFYCGALTPELASIYAQKISQDPEAQTFYTFNDSNPSLVTLITPQQQFIQEEASLWLAKRLQNNPLFDLNQGQFQYGNASAKNRTWYTAAAIMTMLWLLCFIIGNSIRIHSLNTQIKEVDTKIALIYRQFFPQAQQIINPRFRIGQLIKSHKNEDDQAFWLLLDQLAQAIKNNPATIEQLRFQNHALQVTLISKDFNTLDRLQTNLQKAHVTVKQSQASSRDQQVLGTLELTL